MTTPACVAYVRVSTERQAGEQFTSLADQQAAIEQLATKLGVTVGRWYRDEGASGATAEGRPAFSQMLADLEAARRRVPGLVLVLNDSRFGRFNDPEEAAYWRHHLRRLGWMVRFCEADESQDKTSRSVMRAIGAAQATAYRDAIRANAKRGARGAAEKGYWTREAPFGYRRRVAYPPGRERTLDVGQLKAPDEKVSLTPHPEEAAIVLWAFQRYATGELSAVRLVGELEARAPVRKWSTRHVQALLQNPAYCGDVVGGRRAFPGDEHDGAWRRPESEWYGMRDAHPAIVPRQLWQEVQRRVSVNAYRGRAVKATYLLSGIMRCAICGEPYIGGGGGKNGKFYKCSGGTGGACPGRIGTVSRHLIDDVVVADVGKALSSRAVLRQVERALDEALAALPADMAAGEATLRASRAKAEKRRARLVALLADGTLQPDEAAPQLEALRTEIADADAELDRARFHRQGTGSAAEIRERALAAVTNIKPRLEALHGDEEKRPALRALLEPFLAGASFDKTTRELVLRLRPLPVLGLLPDNRPGQVVRVKEIVRRHDLRKPGYSEALYRGTGNRRRRAG